jgi:mannose-6-phosphate isomerase
VSCGGVVEAVKVVIKPFANGAIADEPPWERKCARAILRLAQQFPGDAGAMAPFFLNYLLIAPGESFFMAPNEPHAYVAG